MQEHKKEVIDEIQNAGALAHAYFHSEDFSNEVKNDGSVVTHIDAKIEERLEKYVREHFPDDTIIGEEGEGHEGSSGYVWYIDPIDGTDNFLRKIPFCAISVARLGDSKEGSFAVVHNPMTEQTFSAFGEERAYENEHPCTLTRDSLGGRLVISIGRGKEEWMKGAAYAMQHALGAKYGKCHAYGSTALEIAYVAANRIDAQLMMGLQPYDYAAGMFLVDSVEGAISIFEDGAWSLWEGTLKELCAKSPEASLVSHSDVHQDILESIGDIRSWE